MIKVSKVKNIFSGWGILSFVFIVLIVLPNINIFINIIQEPNDNWNHIKEYLLKDYIINSIVLVASTSVLTLIIGTTLAWMVSVYDFPMVRFFRWGLILSLSIPPYIAAYTYNGIMNYTGVIQTFLRNSLDITSDPRFFDIMSMNGAVFIFTMFLYPYVFIIMKSFLQKQSASLIETSSLLGRNYLETFFYIIIPISRAAIIGGVSLVALEVLSDYGVVKYFGITTFSTAIFKTWFGMGDIDSAVRLSSILMALVLGILILEKFLRGRKNFSYSNTKIRPIARKKLKGIKGVLAFIYSFIIFSLGFVIPLLQLISWGILTYREVLDREFLKLITNSLTIAGITSGIIIIVAVIIANYSRISDSWISKIYSKVTTVGYSIPGAVIAIGVIVFFIDIDNRLFWLYKIINSDSGKLVLSTSVVMLIFAYIIRFLAIGFNSVDAGFEKIGKKFFEASRILGMGITKTFFRVDLKMISYSIMGGFLLVLVDILKELPLTLILRPFNFNTLATKAFEYANDEMIHEASIPSLLIILISFISIYIFYKVGDREVN